MESYIGIYSNPVLTHISDRLTSKKFSSSIDFTSSFLMKGFLFLITCLIFLLTRWYGTKSLACACFLLSFTLLKMRSPRLSRRTHSSGVIWHFGSCFRIVFGLTFCFDLVELVLSYIFCKLLAVDSTNDPGIFKKLFRSLVSYTDSI